MPGNRMRPRRGGRPVPASTRPETRETIPVTSPLRRLAAAVAASAFLGCGGGSPAAIPANPPPIPVDASGKPKPPPTAAGDVKPITVKP